MKQIYTLLFSIISLSTFGQNYDLGTKMVASDRANVGRYGTSVSIDGNIAVSGAYTENRDASGAANMNEAGAAYVLEQSGGAWIETAKLVPSDRAAGDRFGYSVSVSGNKIIVGAYIKVAIVGGSTMSGTGAAYIFEKIAGVWTETAKLMASDFQADDNFGCSVFLSGDKAIVGSFQEDHDGSGGNLMSNAGSAYIFELSGGVWNETAKLVANDRAAADLFGWNVSISGNKAIVGAHQGDFDAAGGNSIANAGAAYVFELNGGAWSEVAKLVASDRENEDHFGWSVGISGDKVVVGADREDHDDLGGNPLNGAGSAYVYEKNGGNWSQTAKLVASDRLDGDEFGISIGISGDNILVGAKLVDYLDSNGVSTLNSGAAYLFKLESGVWNETNKFIATDPGVNDYFARALAIAGDKIIVGAYAEDHDLLGANPLTDAGSVYLYQPISSVSLKENDFANQLRLFPNPATNQITISNFSAEIDNISILDMTGKLITSFALKTDVIDVSMLQNGIYFIQIQAGNEISTQQLVKQ